MILIIILPHQLFDLSFYNQLFETNEKHIIVIMEHKYFFTRFPFHKLKLAYHRATMRYYYDKLKLKLIHKTFYIDFYENNKLTSIIDEFKPTKIKMFDPIEKMLRSEFNYVSTTDSPYFLNTHNDNLIIQRQLKTIRHDSFYKIQRLRFNVLIKNGKPLYDRWSFDTENRLKFPRDISEPSSLNIINNDYTNEALTYIKNHFGNNYGETSNFIYPINRRSGLIWLDNFIKRKLINFGKYEDAIGEHIIIGYHSAISPMMNVGLLTPHDILNKFKKIKISNNNIATVEGFYRQVIGWREYNYFIYDLYGDYLENNYYYKNKNKISDKIWNGQTDVPYVDKIIDKIYKYAYCHHIERLMAIGNYFNLLDIHPKEMYKWFMTLFIDSYDVFMIPNVYGMLLYGYIDKHKHMMTKPYLSASNYIMKMSDYKGGEWQNIIDALYYDKIRRYYKKFKKIYSLSMIIKKYADFPAIKKKQLKKIASLST